MFIYSRLIFSGRSKAHVCFDNFFYRCKITDTLSHKHGAPDIITKQDYLSKKTCLSCLAPTQRLIIVDINGLIFDKATKIKREKILDLFVFIFSSTYMHNLHILTNTVISLLLPFSF